MTATHMPVMSALCDIRTAGWSVIMRDGARAGSAVTEDQSLRIASIGQRAIDSAQLCARKATGSR